MTPEQLMRSRYTAFCRKNIDYLIATHHPSKRRADDRATLAHTINETEWLGLKIIRAETGEREEIGVVEFAAFYQRNGLGQLHERSEFIREQNCWYYMQGEILDPIKLGRNEPCWCNSGKKYKKCHGL